jgi:hypothetical protein
MISATGRISLIAPAVCRADHHRRVRRAKADVTVERGSPNYCQPGSVLVPRNAPMLVIEVHATTAASGRDAWKADIQISAQAKC